jgi:dephospho-CoA kinase
MRQKANMRPQFISITGDIASGKSSALSYFRGHGFDTYSADTISRELYLQKKTVIDISRLFDIRIVDGQIDKAELRKTIFSNPEKRAELENYLHPLILNRLGEIMSIYIGNRERVAVFFEIPLLFECFLEKSFDINLLITAQENKKVWRIMKRDGCTKEEALSILQSQMPQSEKIEKADIIVDNSKGESHLMAQLKVIHQSLEFYKKRQLKQINM